MTIFDYLNSLFYSKKQIDLNCDDESQFSMFMVNRWGSFYSKEIANYINQTSNRYGSVFLDKQDQYIFLYHLMPHLKFKKINYIKKTKKEDEEVKKVIPEFMSLKEYKQNVEFVNTLSK
jgi:hypothetical protein